MSNKRLSSKRQVKVQLRFENHVGIKEDVNKGVFGNEDCDNDSLDETTVSNTGNFDTVNCDSNDADMVDSVCVIEL
ncbi:hypothetical protein Tco_0875839 [Tanacetum coccineum]|uniref:Uncharacterized protein n=1 Tax=Tanacetum coccineum TaxID=301880 RepID=A0ABQ5BU33_9ASTR